VRTRKKLDRLRRQGKSTACRKKLFRNVPREQRSLWMGHVVRDGSRTTANYESDDPEMLADVALATDCVIALIQQHCAKSLFAVDVLLTKKDLQAIGARVIPEMLRKQRVSGGHDRDRTCDQVARDTNSRVKSKRKGR
jgi:hypothetical protein